jgi:multicomponent Na+:H+ antiporter subunit E
LGEGALYGVIKHSLILIAALSVTWLTLSGYFKPMLLTLGVISILFVIGLTLRMSIPDRETAPYLSVPRTLAYFVWLFKEIIKANVQVVRAVLNPDMLVSPTLTKIPLSQENDLSKVMFANSITLTPGTVSVMMQEDHILVHALLNEMSAPEDFREMGVRSAKSVGENINQSEQAGS